MKVLSDIVARKRQDVALRIAAGKVDFNAVAPTHRRFGEALKKPGRRFILECKKASPSEGVIRENFDLTQIAEAYRGFADAVSVLADEPYFQGSLENVSKTRSLLPQPILCKDFIVDPYQVFEARAFGADAVLLMLSVLDDETYKKCEKAASALSMDVLTEVHDEEELARALALNATIIGVNNRNLKTMKVDLETTRKLARKIPKGKIVVCESGIKTYQDTLKLSAVADAFLVGTTLMREKELPHAVRKLLFGRVKICGLTRAEDARAAYKLGASFGGVIFAKESPRAVTLDRAREIHQAAPDLPLVGVFVNEAPAKILEATEALNLAAIQLHGEETREMIDKLRLKLPPGFPQGREIWKAYRVADKLPAFESVGADRLLLDTASGNLRGGSGKTFDWSLLNAYPEKDRCLLAGGLSPENITRAAEIGVFALDVNSGVESEAGIKDHRAIEQLFSNLRGIPS